MEFNMQDMQGWLLKAKRNLALFRKNAPRFFKVEEIGTSGSFELALCYYTHPREKEAKGWMYLEDVAELSDSPKDNQFTITGPDRALTLAAQTPKELEMWLRGLCYLCPQAKCAGIQTNFKPFKRKTMQFDEDKEQKERARVKRSEREREREKARAETAKWESDKASSSDKPSDHRLKQPAGSGNATSRLHGAIRGEAGSGYTPPRGAGGVRDGEDGGAGVGGNGNDDGAGNGDGDDAGRDDPRSLIPPGGQKYRCDGHGEGKGADSDFSDDEADGRADALEGSMESVGGDDMQLMSLKVDARSRFRNRMNSWDSEEDGAAGGGGGNGAVGGGSGGGEEKGGEPSADEGKSGDGPDAGSRIPAPAVAASPERPAVIRRAQDGCFTDSPDKGRMQAARKPSVDDLIGVSRKINLTDDDWDGGKDGREDGGAESKLDFSQERTRYGGGRGAKEQEGEEGAVHASGSGSRSRSGSAADPTSPIAVTGPRMTADAVRDAAIRSSSGEGTGGTRSRSGSGAELPRGEAFNPNAHRRHRPPRPPSGPRPVNASKSSEAGVDADSNFVEENWDDSPQKKGYRDRSGSHASQGSGREDEKENSDNESGSRGSGAGAGAAGKKRDSFRPEFAGGVKADDNFVDDDWDD